MNKKDASAEVDTAVVEAAAVVTEEDEAGTATDEETTTKEEDTENSANPKNTFFSRYGHAWICSLAPVLLDDEEDAAL